MLARKKNHPFIIQYPVSSIQHQVSASTLGRSAIGKFDTDVKITAYKDVCLKVDLSIKQKPCVREFNFPYKIDIGVV